MKNDKIKLYASIIFVLSICVMPITDLSAQLISCEKGDLLCRKMAMPYLSIFGHTGIYEKWNGTGDPENKTNHWVLESQLIEGPRRTTLDAFYNASDWLGAGSLNPTAAQRNAIISYPPLKFNNTGFSAGGPGQPEFRGYSDPEKYRCDGLAERAYEEANINVPNGIVPNNIDEDVETDIIATYPTYQWSIMPIHLGVGPTVQITSITCPSDPNPDDQYYKGTITITAHLNDGPNGSGTKLAQFWDDDPPTTWSSSPNIDKDKQDADIEDDYTGTWVTTTSDDGSHTLYVKAFDQAGNSTVSSGETIVVDNTDPTASASILGEQTTETSITVQGTVTDANPHTQCYGYTRAGQDTTWKSSNTHTFGGLTPNTTYTLYVLGRDKAGNIGSDSASDTTLPVELSAFSANFLDNKPTLYWTTQSETDNIGWNIYRTKNDDNFVNASKINIQLISGYGTTSEPHDYIYEDEIEYAIPGDTYWYWLESIDLGGVINHYNVVAKLVIPDDYEPPVPPELPIIYGLYQNAPNPFNPAYVYQTKVFFCLHKSADVKIDVYNIKGQLIKCIYNKHAEFDENNPKPKVAYWDGKDERGKSLSAGVYLYRLLINDETEETKKLILAK